jgi:pimeloyl-ACP methyl ester carboxylesterase
VLQILGGVNLSTNDAKISEVWDTVGGLEMHGWAGTDGDPEGKRPPIVLLHGLGVSTTYLMPTMQRLAKRYRVYAPDLPGFGPSQKPIRAMRIEKLADALAAWIAARGLDRAVFVCNSMGCQVAVDLATRRPGLVERLVLSGPTIDPRAGSAFVQILRLLRDGIYERPSLWFIAGFDYVRAWPLRVLETLRMAIADHVEQKLPNVKAPTLVVRGAKDPIASRRWVEEMVKLLPSGRMEEIEGTGHAVNYSAPERFVELIEGFIVDVPARDIVRR